MAPVQCVTADCSPAMRCSRGTVTAVFPEEGKVEFPKEGKVEFLVEGKVEFPVEGREWSCLEQPCKDPDRQSHIWVANCFC